MCYDIKAKLESQLQFAKRFGDSAAIRELEQLLEPYWAGEIHVASGFSHPELLVYQADSLTSPEFASWGLIPSWVKTKEDAIAISNKTINARGETFFEKPAFRRAAKSNRGLIFVDGFYEHHHTKTGTIPYLIQRKDLKPMCMAALVEEWVNPDTGELVKTFSMVTSPANPLLTEIHNNPKLKGPRMPLIFNDGAELEWLVEIQSEVDQEYIQNLVQPNLDLDLTAYKVNPIRGKKALGNVPEACLEIQEPQQDAQTTLDF